MKSILSIIVGIAVLMLTIVFCFGTMNVMLVHDNATVYLDKQECPLKLTSDGLCSVKGNLTHNIFGEAEIALPDGSVLITQSENVKGAAYLDGDSHYRPFGSAFAFIVGLGILLIGVGIACGFPLTRLFSLYGQLQERLKS